MNSCKRVQLLVKVPVLFQETVSFTSIIYEVWCKIFSFWEPVLIEKFLETDWEFFEKFTLHN